MLNAITQRYKEDQLPPLEQQGTLAHILHNDAFSAILLLGAASAAFYCANSTMPFLDMTLGEFYQHFWHYQFGLEFHTLHITQSLHHWINDGLMAVFFFVVGLEIKRELVVGELASLRKAALPIAGAIGGMVVPALIYYLINWGSDGAVGGGIPMATDIAFAIGVLGLLSGRVPPALAIFLMALAIVDDLGAVLVIAVFYTQSIAAQQLLIGLGLIAVSFVLALFGVRNSLVYFGLFGLIWFNFLQSGVHATVAGVLFALTIPVDARYETPLFIDRIRELLRRFDDVDDESTPKLVNARQQRIVRAIESECIHVEAPLQRLENKLHPFTVLLIMPLFAFANAGVSLDTEHLWEQLFSRVTLGIVLGLLVGKQLGITLFAWIVVRLKLAELPQGITWKQMYAASCLASIGFTMSLFISELAFSPGSHEVHAAAQGTAESLMTHAHLSEAKIGVLVASTVAAIYGIIVMFFATEKGGGVTARKH